MLNGITGLAINHVDTIGKLEKIKICIGYDYNGEKVEYFRTNMDFLKDSKPIYEEMDGNFGDISSCKTFDELPLHAQKVILKIEELTNTKVSFIGTGAGREQIIVR